MPTVWSKRKWLHARSVVRFHRLIFVLAILVLGMRSNSTEAAERPEWLGNENPELSHWKKLHAEEEAKEKEEEQRRLALRDQMKASIDDLVRAGQSVQSDILPEDAGVAPSQVSAPRLPSVLDGKGDYVLVGAIFACVVLLTTVMLVRQKREAALRELTGAFLSDGLDAATLRMPAFFAPAAVLSESRPNVERIKHDAAEEKEATPPKDPVQEFFTEAPTHLASMGKALQELSALTEEAQPQPWLRQLLQSIIALKTKASVWEVRPAWQMSSALELLVQRLLEKPKDAKPSVFRTVASAADLLRDLCVPGVKPDLIINPPLQILAVDDDPLCLRSVVFALQKAMISPDMAEDGEKALTYATAKPYDMIFMDIQMPGMDGMTACAKIHETEANPQTPIVFVTVQSDFQTRAKSTVMGGSDLIAKPFLIVELTVKAMTFAIRHRLQLTSVLPATSPDVAASKAGAADLSAAAGRHVRPIPA